MDYLILTAVTLLLVYGLYISLTAGFLIITDSCASFFQTIMHLVLILLVPIVGALVVLHFINDHSTERINKLWLPWPTGWVIRAEPVGPKVIAASVLLGFLGQIAVGYVVLSIVFLGWPALVSVGPHERTSGIIMTAERNAFRQQVKLVSGETVLVYIPRRHHPVDGAEVLLIRPLRYPYKVVGYLFESPQTGE